MPRTRAVAVFANTLDYEAVVRRAELVQPTDLFLKLGQFLTDELDDFSTFFTEQMFVMRIAVVVFIRLASTKLQFPQQSRLDQQRECPVDRRAADAKVLLLHAGQKLIGLEMVVLLEDVLHHAE